MVSELGTGIDKGLKRSPNEDSGGETDVTVKSTKSVKRQSDSEAPSVISSTGGKKKAVKKTNVKIDAERSKAISTRSQALILASAKKARDENSDIPSKSSQPPAASTSNA